MGNTPLRWYKQDTHGGGVRVPMIVHYPRNIEEPGAVRNQFHYVTDIAPTVLEILDTEPRSNYHGYDQMPIAGTSLAYTFGDGNCPTQKPIQHFEMMGKRGLWHDGWKAVSRHEPDEDYDTEEWELFNLDRDFSETNNLAASEPDRLRKMIDMWWVEAGRHGVLPLDDRHGWRRPPGSDTLTYRFVPPMAHVPRAQSPTLGRGTWSLLADIDIGNADTEGVIYAQGSFLDGFSLFIQDGALCLVFNVLGVAITGRSATRLPTGRTTVGLLFERSDNDRGAFTLQVDGREVGSTVVPDVTRMSKMRGVDVGRDQHAPVTDAYRAPFEFTGIIRSVDVRLG